MFTMAQSTMQVAQEIQADHRRRAASWRFARRAHRRARHDADAQVTLIPAPSPTLAPVVALRPDRAHAVTSVA
jgi:hypothetical protein